MTLSLVFQMYTKPKEVKAVNVLELKFQYNVEDYITFSIRVVCDDYSGKAEFCISKHKLIEKLTELEGLYNNLVGSCRMDDYDSDDFMLFEMESLGHMTITGQLGGSYHIPYLKYQYYTDQTVLAEIISSFRSMVE